ncbi:MAG: chemotaxis-specific protein-glutamate methyltransferase CheB [Candidatus Heimdallarchaeota archaeon]|nr:MAG: chemotaxis-specific protein-glutamate methyltransferase CheB [Candidatus Heimdallarchaeota archaeon]
MMENVTRVFLIDDSAIVRQQISQMIMNSEKNIIVVGTAMNGRIALEKMILPRNKADVVIIDVVMPEMDGIETINHIMDRFPTPVIVISALKKKKEIDVALSELGVAAFESGTVEFVRKPDPWIPNDKERFKNELILKIENLAKIDFLKIFSIFNIESLVKEEAIAKPLIKEPSQVILNRHRAKIIVIGASTGGPRAISMIFSMLPNNFPPILVIQHMPIGMVKPWVTRLKKMYSNLMIEVANNGVLLRPNHIYIAPSGKHCLVNHNKRIKLESGEKVNFVIPSADVTFKSVAEVFGKDSLGIILTGMGQDGCRGARIIKDSGGKIIAEDESTSIIPSMPKAVIEGELADRISPLHKIPTSIRGLGWI